MYDFSFFPERAIGATSRYPKGLEDSLPGGYLSLTEKTSAAAAAADAGLVFYKYGGHRIIPEMDIRNRPAPLVASAEATGERGQSL